MLAVSEHQAQTSPFSGGTPDFLLDEVLTLYRRKLQACKIVVQRIMLKHRGSIRLRSSVRLPRAGTVLSLFFPRATSMPADNAA